MGNPLVTTLKANFICPDTKRIFYEQRSENEEKGIAEYVTAFKYGVKTKTHLNVK